MDKKDYNEIIKIESLAEIYFDEGKFEEHKNLLTDSFEFESPFGSFKEVDKYMDWLEQFYQMTQSQGGTRHLVMNPVVEIENDEATFTGYLYIINKKNGSFMGTSIMKDKLKLIDNTWKFSYRSVAPDQDLSDLQ